jgi:hypothetical protein
MQYKPKLAPICLHFSLWLLMLDNYVSPTESWVESPQYYSHVSKPAYLGDLKLSGCSTIYTVTQVET